MENLICKVIKEYNSMRQDQREKTLEWINNGFKQRENYVRQFQSRLYESLGIMPNIEDAAYRKNFDEITEVISEFYKKLFI